MTTAEFNRALVNFNAGKLEEARKHLKHLLQKSPGHLDALYLLAVIEQTSKAHEAALALYEKVLIQKPDHAWAHYNKALLLSEREQHTEALPHHDRAVQLSPSNFWALINRGNSHAALRRFQDAIADYDKALEIQPRLPNALANKGNALFELGLSAEALDSLDKALQLHPEHVEAWLTCCQVLAQLGRVDEAIASAERALSLQPELPEAWLRKGSALLEGDHPEEGLVDIEKAIAINPRDAKAWAVFGDAMLKLDRAEEAIPHYDKSLKLNSKLILSLVNKGVAWERLGRDDLAKSCYEQALQVDPDHADANRLLACSLLRQHDYRRACDHYEYRLRRSTSHSPRILPTVRPRWSGPASDTDVLLWGEQGLGDQILYASILPDLLNYAPSKLVALDRRLLPLFERSMPGFRYVDLADASDELGFSTHLPLGSLLRHYRLSVESFATARHPYLMADPDRVSDLRQKIVRPGKRVCGISWSSNRKILGSAKSISLGQMLPPLASVPLHFVNLQYGDTAEEREVLQRQHGIDVQNVDEVDNLRDIDGLAALIQACDFVLTTSNTTAHLAGALGKETLVLLPFGKGRFWYWSEHAGQNLWYPSIRMFEQDQNGLWTGALARVKAHLESLSEK
jgi:tetratricopeptide (TPR) repeat protein